MTNPTGSDTVAGRDGPVSEVEAQVAAMLGRYLVAWGDEWGELGEPEFDSITGPRALARFLAKKVSGSFVLAQKDAERAAQ